jgi:hypothetical protein
MNRKIGIVSAVAVSLPLAVGVLTHERRSQGDEGANVLAVEAVARADAPTASPKALPFYTYSLMAAVAEPLFSLPRMKQVVAATTAAAAEASAAKLLQSQLTTVGLGPVRIGMTVAEVAEEGISLVPLDNTAHSECQYLGLPEQLKSISFMAVDDQIIRVDVGPGSSVETKSGIGIGSSEAEILDHYQGRIETAPHPETGGQYFVFTPSGEGEDLYRLVFETNAEGEVVAFRSGQFPAVIWPEGCL